MFTLFTICWASWTWRFFIKLGKFSAIISSGIFLTLSIPSGPPIKPILVYFMVSYRSLWLRFFLFFLLFFRSNIFSWSMFKFVDPLLSQSEYSIFILVMMTFNLSVSLLNCLFNSLSLLMSHCHYIFIYLCIGFFQFLNILGWPKVSLVFSIK